MKWPWGQRVVRAESVVPDDVETETRAKGAIDAFYAPRPPMTREEIRAMLADLALDSLRHLHRAVWHAREERWARVAHEVVSAVMCDGGEGPEEVALPRITAAYLPAPTLRRPRAIVRAAAKATVEADVALTAVLSVVEAMIEEKMQAQVRGGT